MTSELRVVDGLFRELGRPAQHQVIYHADCPDGWVAAFQIARAHQERFGNQDAVRLCPWQHHEAMPALDTSIQLNGGVVLFVDIAPKKADWPKVWSWIAAGINVVILDHHESAAAVWAKERERYFHGEIAPFSDVGGKDDAPIPRNLTLKLSRDRSGAGLVSDFLGTPLYSWDTIVCYVEDRDLWRFKLPDSRAVNAALGALPYKFTEWDELFDDFAAKRAVTLQRLVMDGTAILESQNRIIEEHLRRATVIYLNGKPVPCVNASALFSDVAMRLLESAHPDNKMVAYCYFDGQRPAAQQWTYGLRSRPDFNCEEIARLYGGGGHQQSAAFRAATFPPPEYPKGTLIDAHAGTPVVAANAGSSS